MTAHDRWLLAEVTLTDVLGFQGSTRFSFGPGLTVLEASNHTGKTSLALGLLWALTGSVPKLGRVNRTSFRLTNRHAGAQAEPRVALRLETPEGRTLELERSYSARSKVGDRLALVVDGEELGGSPAAERLARELGLSSASLEGVGVVLQDQRHALIAGGEAELGSVVSDVLGLEALAEVVPVLRAAAREAAKLEREAARFQEGEDPVRRWEEEDRRLAAEFRTAEANARRAGFDAGELDDPLALASAELEGLASALGREDELESDDPRAVLEELRGDLRVRRAHSPLMRRATDCDAARRAAAEEHRSWSDERAGLARLAGRAGEVAAERAGAAVDEARAHAEVAACASARGELEAEQRLLQVAHEHVRGHAKLESCPVCRQGVDAAELLRTLGERLDQRLASELAELARRERDARRDLSTARDRAGRSASWEREVERFVVALEARVHETRDVDPDTQLLREELAASLAAVEPGKDAVHFRELDLRLAALEAHAGEAERLADAEDERARSLWQRQEAEVFQPLEQRLERVRECLVPLVEAARRVDEHGRGRGHVEERSGELERIRRQAAEYAGDLEEIARAVADVEREHAQAAIARCEPFVSGFFARVAGNPDYTGLSIAAEVARGKVTYRLRASSKTSPGLDDAAGHVLSEGDLSAAGIALLVGLATGAAHRVGFLVLDDPAQGMDDVLAAALARELAASQVRPQTIVLTHQPHFAEELVAQGARALRLVGWSGGRAELVAGPDAVGDPTRTRSRDRDHESVGEGAE